MPALDGLLRHGRPRCWQDTLPAEQADAREQNLRKVLNNLASTGIDAKKHPILVNTVSVSAHYTVNKIGTITATLGSNLGFWIQCSTGR